MGILTTKEMAEYLNCSIQCVWKYYQAGLLPGMKKSGILCFDKREVDAIIKTWEIRRIPPRKTYTRKVKNES